MKRGRPAMLGAPHLLRLVEEGCPFQPDDFPPGKPPHEAAQEAHRRWAERFVLDSLHHHLQPRHARRKERTT